MPTSQPGLPYQIAQLTAQQPCSSDPRGQPLLATSMPVGGRGSETEAQTPPLLGTQPCSSTTPTASTSDNAA
jgi:hypothetical protein